MFARIWRRLVSRVTAKRSAGPGRTLHIEQLESRDLPSSTWFNFNGNAQHTGISGVAAQSMDLIHWQASIDSQPGDDKHYGEPVFTPANTVIFPVTHGSTGAFVLEGVGGKDGHVLWSVTSDYQEPPYTWLPPFQAVYDPLHDRAYFAGNGGTIYYVNHPDTPGATISGQMAFYGLANYQANKSAFNNSVEIDTPLTIDSSGIIYFGYMVTGSNPLGLTGGIARLAPDGTGILVSARIASSDINITRTALGSAPALSNNGSTLYVAVNESGQYYAYLLALDSTTLATKSRVFLRDPRNGNSAGVIDQSTSSPMVAPDGSVFFGVFGNPYNGSRGFLLHFSGDLSQQFTPGAFGWDDTPSVIPTSMIPSYQGSSAFLILSKYNNYVAAETGPSGGDGVNKIAILDPGATELDPNNDGSPSLQVMKEVMTVASPTPDTDYTSAGFPNAVREWCTNGTAVDPATDSVFINNEDGNAYRWNLGTSALTQSVMLTGGIGEPYTPTAIGPDGTIYAINGGNIFALGAGVIITNVSAPGNTITAGVSFLVSVQAFGNPSPGTAILSASPADPLGNLPISGNLLSSNIGFFLGTLNTAGSYNLTATVGTFSASMSLTVLPAPAVFFTVAAPPSAITGTTMNLTVTARDAFGNLATGYTGAVHFSSSDPQANLPANSTLSGGTGIFSFSLATSGTQTITAGDATSASPRTLVGVSGPISTRGLTVTNFIPTVDGFTVTFNKPFIPEDLALYGPTLARRPDVILFGSGGVGSIHGTLLIDAGNQSLTFKATSSYLHLLNGVFGGHDSVALPDATYTLTLVSGSGNQGFLDILGAGLDGLGNGTLHNYATTFATHYQSNATPVLAVPDFARGPDENTPIAVPNDISQGIPITLYNAAHVTDATFTLSYNPALLVIAGTLQGAASDASDPVTTFTLVSVSGGLATFNYHDATPQVGTVVLGDIRATVPNTAKNLYQVKEELQLGGIVITGGAQVASAGGVHVNAYFADVTADHQIDGLDKLQMDAVSQGKATGLSAFAQLDPVIVADVGNDAQVDPASVAGVDIYLSASPAGSGQFQIPVPPGLSGITAPNAADPTLSLLGEPSSSIGEPSGVSGRVTIALDDPHPPGSTGLTEAILALQFDPTIVAISSSDIRLGSIPSSGTGWQLSTVVDPDSGQIGILLYSNAPILAAQAGSLVTIDIHLLTSAMATDSPIRIMDKATPLDQFFGTVLMDAQSALVLCIA